MKYSVLILILLICSCKKENFTEVNISGSVTNIVTNQPIQGIQLKLTKQPKYANTRMNGNIVKVLETDANGNFNFTESLSDRFVYTLVIDDEDYDVQYSYLGYKLKHSVENNISQQNFEFKTAATATLRLNYNNYTVNSFQDTLLVIPYTTTGDTYYQPIYHVTNNSNYRTYSDLKIMQGLQHTDFIFTKNGVDSVFTKTYSVAPGEIQVLNINLY
jgi:hypothetical protein